MTADLESKIAKMVYNPLSGSYSVGKGGDTNILVEQYMLYMTFKGVPILKIDYLNEFVTTYPQNGLDAPVRTRILAALRSLENTRYPQIVDRLVPGIRARYKWQMQNCYQAVIIFPDGREQPSHAIKKDIYSGSTTTVQITEWAIWYRGYKRAKISTKHGFMYVGPLHKPKWHKVPRVQVYEYQ